MKMRLIRSGGFASLAGVLLLIFAPQALGAGQAAPVGTAVIAEAQMMVSTEGITHEEYLQQQEELNGWLVEEMPGGAFDAPIHVQLTPEEFASFEQAAPSLSTPLKIGVVRALEPAVHITGLTLTPRSKEGRRPTSEALRPKGDGGLVWARSVTSDDAGAIRIHVENFSLPENAELYFYSLAGEAFGPFTGKGPNGDGQFWAPSVFGSEGILQLHMSAPVSDEDLAEVSFSITEVGHIGTRFTGGLPVTAGGSFCGNPSCIVDASCNNGTPADPAKNAVAKMEWVAGAFIYTCTGGLINDNNPSQSNYFLTANHCISKNNNAQNVQFYWRFATSSCNGACPSNGGWPYKTNGSTVTKTGRKGDFTLLHLNANPPSGSVFLGWTSAPIAFTNGADLHRISNPNFGPQVYSMHDVDTGAVTCSGWPRGERIYSNDAVGGIDGGSSGSTVVNSASQIVGQLSGTCGYNPGDPCDSASNSTVDGAFAYYYSLVQPFLNP